MSMSCPIIPKVAACHALPGVCRLSRGLTLEPSAQSLPDPVADALDAVVADCGPVGDAKAAVRLRFEQGSVRADAHRGEHDGQCGTPDAAPDARDESPESYALRIAPGQIVITAGGAAGWFYALQSLRQIIADERRAGGDADLAGQRIEDRPRFAWRGSMIDSARHMPSVDWIKGHLDRMAALKLNRFHWHLCDDHGWRAEIRSRPALAEKAAWRGTGHRRYGGVYTQAQMREVADHAARRCITVIPEIEMPGHCNAALVAYPELSCSGQPLPVPEAGGWDAFLRDAGRHAFCAAKPAVDDFLADVLAEINEVFDPPYLHIGGDETPRGDWDACPACAALMQREGLTDSAALRVHFLRRVHDLCRDRLGKPTIAWTEGVHATLPEDQLVHAWFPAEAATAARLGRAVINSNHEWTYLDYPRDEADAEHKPDWMIVLPLEKVYHFDPLPEGLEAEHAHRVLGSEAPLWTEHARDEATMDHQLMPRLAAFAEALWSPRMGRNFDEFRRRLDAYGDTKADAFTAHHVKTPTPTPSRATPARA